MSFSEDAVRLAGVAGMLLGWRPDEFWRATPAELAAVLGVAGGGGHAPGEGMDGAALARLIRAMPDQRFDLPQSGQARPQPLP
ncbi:MAG: phage tail assembly chaperone [Sphingobium sp.]